MGWRIYTRKKYCDILITTDKSTVPVFLPGPTRGGGLIEKRLFKQAREWPYAKAPIETGER
jgi:hypothetical protein